MGKLVETAKGTYNASIIAMAEIIEEMGPADESDLKIELRAALTDVADEFEDMKIKAKATYTDLDARISKLENASCCDDASDTADAVEVFKAKKANKSTARKAK